LNNLYVTLVILAISFQLCTTFRFKDLSADITLHHSQYEIYNIYKI